MPETAPASERVREGWTALSAGSWKKAWAVFERELEAGESAEARSQLGGVVAG
jgi:hypothetical protein